MENEERKEKEKERKQLWLLCLKLLIASALLYAITPEIVASDAGKKVVDFCAGMRVNWFTWVALIAVGFHIANSYVKKLGKDEYPTMRFWLMFIALFLNYFLYLRNNITGANLFEINSSGVYYVDILAFILPLWLAKFEPRKDPVSGPKPPIELQEDIPSEEDSIGRDSQVNDSNDGAVTTLAKTIIGNSPKKSFSIAITGEWGSGKTTYLDILTKQLEKRKGDVDLVIIRFQPWEWVGDKDIFMAFFDELSEALNDHNDRLVRDLKSYTQLLLGKGEETGLTEKLLQVFGVQPTPKTISACRSAINATIKNYNKKIVVMIDDIDRLDGEEILKTLKLIRSIADFRNTYFITALDYNHVAQSIKNDNNIERADDYLKKFFQLTIPLTSNVRDLTKDLILPSIKAAIHLSNNEEKEILDILEHDRFTAETNIFGGQSAHISNILINVRTLKHLVNSFCVTYLLLKDECDLASVFYMELLKVYDFPVYSNLLTTNNILIIKDGSEVRLQIRKSNGNGNSETIIWKPYTKSIINTVFPSQDFARISSKSIAYIYNFHKYIYCQSFEELPAKKMEELVKLPKADRIIEEQKIYISNKRKSYLRQLVMYIESTNSVGELSTHLEVAFSIAKRVEDEIVTPVVQAWSYKITSLLYRPDPSYQSEEIARKINENDGIHITIKILIQSIYIDHPTSNFNRLTRIKMKNECLELGIRTYQEEYNSDIETIIKTLFSIEPGNYLDFGPETKSILLEYLNKVKSSYSKYIIRSSERHNGGVNFIIDPIILAVYNFSNGSNEVTEENITAFTEFVNSIDTDEPLASAPKRYLSYIIESIKNGRNYFTLEGDEVTELMKLMRRQ